MQQANERHMRIKSLDGEANATELARKTRDEEASGDSELSAAQIVDESL